MVALCCLRQRRYATAGAFLAFSTLLRVFPLFFFLPLAAKALAFAWRRLSRGLGIITALPRRYLDLFASAAVTAALLFALTGLLPRGFGHWREFRANIETHVANISPNVVGLTEALAFQRGADKVTAEEFEALKERRRGIYRIQLAAVFLPALALVAWLARRRSDLAAAGFALPLLYAGLGLAAYYYLMLAALILVHRRSTRRLP